MLGKKLPVFSIDCPVIVVYIPVLYPTEVEYWGVAPPEVLESLNYGRFMTLRWFVKMELNSS